MTIQVPENTAVSFAGMDQHDKQGSDFYDKAAAAFSQSSFSGNDRAFLVAFFNMTLEQISTLQAVKKLLSDIVDLNSDQCKCSRVKLELPKLPQNR